MKYTLTTGASTGIGEHFARHFAQKGHHLVLVARSKEPLDNLAKELSVKYGIQVRTIVQDLAVHDAAEHLFQKCNEEHMTINMLINNAGVGMVGEFKEHDFAKMEQMVILNILTLTKLCRLFLPQLEKHDGTILNVASHAGCQPVPYMSCYAATKAYVINFTEALAYEFKNSNVHIMVVAPGAVKTRFFDVAGYSLDKTNFKAQTIHQVIKETVQGLKQKKMLVIPGFRNRWLTFLVRLSPRQMVLKISDSLVRK